MDTKLSETFNMFKQPLKKVSDAANTKVGADG